MGVYLLIIVGATTALTDAAAACPTWPACNGRWIVPFQDTELVIAWGHRVVALLVGVLVLTVTLVSWLQREPRRVRAALFVPLLLYPVQIGIGAVTATSSKLTLVASLHLLIGIGIFGGLIVALAWTLEAHTGESPPDARPGPNRRSLRDEPQEPLTTSGSKGVRARMSTTASAYIELMKPRLMWLLCLVAAAGMALAAGRELNGQTVVATLLGGVLAIGASGTFNHVLERDIDRKMARTSTRPVVTDRIPVRNALAFGAVLTITSVGVFLSVNLLATVLGVAAILFYSVVYTMLLKPNTVQNTVYGGFAGALPALIGWAAVTGTVGVPALALAGVIFLWTPAHFYNLALAHKEDYERGGFPMLPVVRGETVTRRHILLYLGATLLGASILSAVSSLGWLYAATSVLFGSVFLWAVIRLHYEQTRKAAFRSFHASNAFLGTLLLAIIVDTLVL